MVRFNRYFLGVLRMLVYCLSVRVSEFFNLEEHKKGWKIQKYIHSDYFNNWSGAFNFGADVFVAI